MTVTHLVTASELAKLSDDAGNFELIEGELIPVPPPKGDHGRIQANLIAILHHFITSSALGRVFGDVGYQLGHDPDTVLGPDLSFIRSDRLPIDDTAYFDAAPDLAVEIVSPGNSPGDMERKLAIYLQSGTGCIWIVYPREHQVFVHIPDQAPRNYPVGSVLPGEPALPGLLVSVSDIFA